jgi:hypothetical protein
VVAEYLEEVSVYKSKKTFAAYSLTLKLFLESLEDTSKGIKFDYSLSLKLFLASCSRHNLEDIGRLIGTDRTIADSLRSPSNPSKAAFT